MENILQILNIILYYYIMAKTKYNKRNNKRNNKKNNKKTRKFRGGAVSTQNDEKKGANSIFGLDLGNIGNYVPGIFKFELPKFKIPTLNNPFSTNKNKCDVCETDECKKQLTTDSKVINKPEETKEPITIGPNTKSLEGTENQNKETENQNKDTENQKKDTENQNNETENKNKETENQNRTPSNQIGGKKKSKKKTRRNKRNKKI